jgi:LPXTG-site transpeptidase (sortase) family protein
VKRIKPIWIIGLGIVVFIIGMSGVFQSAQDFFINESDYGEPGMQDLGFVPMAMPVKSDQQQDIAPELIETPPSSEPVLIITDDPREDLELLRDRPTPTPTVVPVEPNRIVIPEIELDAPIMPAIMKRLKLNEDIYEQWLAPDEFAVGWHYNTALLGQPGNTVLNGHHNVDGMVFKDLHQLKPGSLIELFGGSLKFTYMVVNVMILPEKGEEFSLRLDNARWLLPSIDERITLITCWPATSNTHRLIVVARPTGTSVVMAEDTPQP